MIGRWNDPPDFVNAEGVKWWDMQSVIGPGDIWLTELPTGEREYVGILNGEIVANSTALDVVAVKLELLDFADRTAK